MIDKRTQIFAENRKAKHDYSILERIEAGIVLSGAEVKSVRLGNISFSGSYIAVIRNELFLIGCNIALYASKGFGNDIVDRNRKILCHSKEIRDIKYKTEAKGLTAIPLRFYHKNNKIKIEIGIVKGKNAADKRNSLRERSIKRDIERIF